MKVLLIGVRKDKYGKHQAKALISPSDLDKLVNDEYTWVYHKGYRQPQVIAHTPNGKAKMENVIMNPSDDERVHHINLNPLDNRRKNLENQKIEEEIIEEETE